jgi:hypothetical protein
VSSIVVSPFFCPFCGRRTPVPDPPEGGAYESVGSPGQLCNCTTTSANRIVSYDIT